MRACESTLTFLNWTQAQHESFASATTYSLASDDSELIIGAFVSVAPFHHKPPIQYTSAFVLLSYCLAFWNTKSNLMEAL